MGQGIHTYKATLFKTLGHPLRLAILDQLRSGEKNVTELQEATQADQSAISQQLSVLRTNHFVTFRKEGTLAYYQNVDPDVYVFLDLGRQLYERQCQRQREHLNAQMVSA